MLAERLMDKKRSKSENKSLKNIKVEEQSSVSDGKKKKCCN
jgi:hypothetical protein